MNVYDEAHGLANAIKNSEEFKQFIALKEKIDTNEDLKKMINDVETKSMEVQTKQMAGQQVSPEDVLAVQQLYQIVLQDPTAAEYMQASMRFSLMMKDVFDIIGEATGTNLTV